MANSKQTITEMWLDEKPVFDCECLVIAASRIRGEWNYNLYQIAKVDGFDEDGNECWYWGWLTGDGEEYGDLADFTAEKYLIPKPL